MGLKSHYYIGAMEGFYPALSPVPIRIILDQRAMSVALFKKKNSYICLLVF